MRCNRPVILKYVCMSVVEHWWMSSIWIWWEESRFKHMNMTIIMVQAHGHDKNQRSRTWTWQQSRSMHTGWQQSRCKHMDMAAIKVQAPKHDKHMDMTAIKVEEYGHNYMIQVSSTWTCHKSMFKNMGMMIRIKFQAYGHHSTHQGPCIVRKNATCLSKILEW